MAAAAGARTPQRITPSRDKKCIMFSEATTVPNKITSVAPIPTTNAPQLGCCRNLLVVLDCCKKCSCRHHCDRTYGVTERYHKTMRFINFTILLFLFLTLEPTCCIRLQLTHGRNRSSMLKAEMNRGDEATNTANM